MPTYEYACHNCGSSMSVVRSIAESDPGYQCENCNQAMTKVYSIGAITFNGSGFYSKDK
jgi:putative FmdB family regulatory protein